MKLLCQWEPRLPKLDRRLTAQSTAGANLVLPPRGSVNSERLRRDETDILRKQERSTGHRTGATPYHPPPTRLHDRRRGAIGPRRQPPAEPTTARATGGGLEQVKHVVVVMQENHSFDNYFGQLHAEGQPDADGLPNDASNPDPTQPQRPRYRRVPRRQLVRGCRPRPQLERHASRHRRRSDGRLHGGQPARAATPTAAGRCRTTRAMSWASITACTASSPSATATFHRSRAQPSPTASTSSPAHRSATSTTKSPTSSGTPAPSPHPTGRSSSSWTGQALAGRSTSPRYRSPPSSGMSAAAGGTWHRSTVTSRTRAWGGCRRWRSWTPSSWRRRTWRTTSTRRPTFRSVSGTLPASFVP